MHISLKRGCFCAAKVFIFFHVRKPFILKSFKVFLKIVKPPNFHVQSVAQFLHLEAKKNGSQAMTQEHLGTAVLSYC